MDYITLAHFLLTVTKEKGAPIREPYPSFDIISEDEYYPRFDVWISDRKPHRKLHRQLKKLREYSERHGTNKGFGGLHSELPHMDNDEFYKLKYRWVSKVDEPILWKTINRERTLHPMKIPHKDGELWYGRTSSSGPCDITWSSPGWQSCRYKSNLHPILSSDGESPDFEWDSSLGRWITRTEWGTIVPQLYDATNGVRNKCLSHVDPSKFPSMYEASEIIKTRKRICLINQEETFCICTKCDWSYDQECHFVKVNGVPCKICFFHWDTLYREIYGGLFVCSEKGCKKGRFGTDDDDEHLYDKTTRFLCSECYEQTSEDVSQYIELDGVQELY